MDNVTHTLTGVMLSRAGLNRWSPHATALLIIASSLPDADIVTLLLLGPLGYLDYHRHLTHSLIAIPVLGCVPLLLVWLFRRGTPLLAGYLLSCAGLAIHIGMDLLNNYGVRLLLPFSGKWFEISAVMVVDVWMLVVLGAALLAPLLSKLVTSEIGGKTRHAGRGWARLALLFVVLWSGWRWTLHERALRMLESHTYQGGAPLHVAAWPKALNPFEWTGYASTASVWTLHQMHVNRSFDPEGGRVYYMPDDAAAIAAASGTEAGRRFLRFSQFPVWRISPTEDGKRVEASDVRFGAPEEGRFVLKVQLDGFGKVRSTSFEIGNPLRSSEMNRSF